MNRRGWYIEPSYKLVTPWDRPKSFTFLARFNELNNDLTRTPSDALTWDWKLYTLALISEIQEHVKLKLEYNIIDESTGGTVEVDNNEFLIQLHLVF
jgi:hypothetical protein